MTTGSHGSAPHPRLRLPFVAPLVAIVAVCPPPCLTDIGPTMMPWDAPLREFWQRPAEVEDQDLFNGPWSSSNAPDPRGEYRLVSAGAGHAASQMLVIDHNGREWAVDRMPADGGAGSIEVVLSRVLSALGYHQPPVYFLPSFMLRDAAGVREERGGRFRRENGAMLAHGSWRWERNPFVGMFPYQGLLVVLLMFNASNLDSSSNMQVDVARGGDTTPWYIVRDLATVLGPHGLDAGRNAETFAHGRFAADVARGHVVFDYDGPCSALVRDRITPDDVGWASFLLARLSERQWHDAFHAGGYDAATASRFIAALRDRIARGRQIGGDDWP